MYLARRVATRIEVSMKIPIILATFVALLGSGACFATTLGPSPEDSDLAVWGQPTNGLQCGLKMRFSPEAMDQNVGFYIRNSEPSSVSFFWLDLQNAATGFSVKDHHGNAVKTGRFYLPSLEPYEVGGPPPRSTVGAHETSRVAGYSFNFERQPGTYDLSFKALLKPVGAAPVALSCGPLQFTV